MALTAHQTARGAGASAHPLEREDPVEPGATGREALTALLQPGITHLLVQRSPDTLPEGVISDVDLVPAVLE